MFNTFLIHLYLKSIILNEIVKLWYFKNKFYFESWHWLSWHCWTSLTFFIFGTKILCFPRHTVYVNVNKVSMDKSIKSLNVIFPYLIFNLSCIVYIHSILIRDSYFQICLSVGLKGLYGVRVISSEHQYKDGIVRFTTVPLNSLFNQVWICGFFAKMTYAILVYKKQWRNPQKYTLLN